MSELNQSNGSGSAAPDETRAPHARTHSHVHYLQKLAAAAVEAVQELALGVRILHEYLGEPTAKQNDTFIAWFETEAYSGDKQRDLKRQEEMIAFWRKLHPGTLPGIILSYRNQRDDEIPF